MWGVIKDPLHQNGPQCMNVPIRVDGQMVEDPATIAYAFNNYFSTTGQKIANEIPHTNVSYTVTPIT